MNKKFSSLFIIVITALYVTVMIFLNEGNDIEGDFRANYFSIIYTIKTNIKLGSSIVQAALEDRINSVREVFRKDMERKQRLSAINTKGNVAVFNSYNRNSIIENYDLEKILYTSKALSSMDQAKIENYLKGGSREEIISALKLIKMRLSDENFNTLKDIWIKVNNDQ